ncbi:MAG: septum formation initiator family protein [Bacillota bacterium]|nr:septum formation initiator family protein [Bacillota bacterium]
MYRFISMVGILIIIGMLVVLGTQYVKYYRVKKDLAEFETRIREYEVRMNELSTEVERLQEIDYIEILARKRLGLVKPGEIIFQFED